MKRTRRIVKRDITREQVHALIKKASYHDE